MRMTRLVAAVGIVSALVLAGGITARLILARDQAPAAAEPEPEVMVSVPGSAAMLEPDPAATPEPELVVMPEPDPVVTPGAELVVMPEPDPVATPAPELVVMPEPGPKAAPDPQVGLPPEGAKSEMEGASQGTVYTWQDGDRTLRVVLQPTPEAPKTETVAGVSEDQGVPKGKVDSTVRKQPEAADGQPVFRSESGGGLMTLPGGVLLALDPEWDQAAVEKFFSQNGMSMDRTSELDYIDNGFFVETEPGFPSLELANALAGQEGVILSSPNWAREMELR